VDESGSFQRSQEIESVFGCLGLRDIIGAKDSLHDLIDIRPAIDKVPDRCAQFIQRKNGVEVLGPGPDGNNDCFTRNFPRDEVILFHKTSEQIIHKGFFYEVISIIFLRVYNAFCHLVKENISLFFPFIQLLMRAYFLGKAVDAASLMAKRTQFHN
jgi:hypothetical protein